MTPTEITAFMAEMRNLKGKAHNDAAKWALPKALDIIEELLDKWEYNVKDSRYLSREYGRQKDELAELQRIKMAAEAWQEAYGIERYAAKEILAGRGPAK